MLTYDEAITADVFHATPTPWGTGRACDDKRGPIRWRRNGRTQTWKTRPGEFSVPVKFGLRAYDRLDNSVAEYVHTAENCPAGHTY